MTAKETYKKRQIEIKKQISDLQKSLRKDALKFKKNETNWGYAGQLGTVLQDLKDINNFMK